MITRAVNGVLSPISRSSGTPSATYWAPTSSINGWAPATQTIMAAAAIPDHNSRLRRSSVPRCPCEPAASTTNEAETFHSTRLIPDAISHGRVRKAAAAAPTRHPTISGITDTDAVAQMFPVYSAATKDSTRRRPGSVPGTLPWAGSARLKSSEFTITAAASAGSTQDQTAPIALSNSTGSSAILAIAVVMFSAATHGGSRSAVSTESSSANTASTGTATANSTYCAQPPVTTWRPRPLKQYTRPATRERNTTTR